MRNLVARAAASVDEWLATRAERANAKAEARREQEQRATKEAQEARLQAAKEAAVRAEYGRKYARVRDPELLVRYEVERLVRAHLGYGADSVVKALLAEAATSTTHAARTAETSYVDYVIDDGGEFVQAFDGEYVDELLPALFAVADHLAGYPTMEMVKGYLPRAGYGLRASHSHYLVILATAFRERGCSAGAESMCAALGWTRGTLASCERVLVPRGLVELQARGRVLTDLGFGRALAVIDGANPDAS